MPLGSSVSKSHDTYDAPLRPLSPECKTPTASSDGSYGGPFRIKCTTMGTAALSDFVPTCLSNACAMTCLMVFTVRM